MSKMCIVKAIIVFSAGAGAGVLATKIHYKKKYEEIIEQEVLSLREQREKYKRELDSLYTKEIVDLREQVELMEAVINDTEVEENESDETEGTVVTYGPDDEEQEEEYVKVSGAYTQEMDKQKDEYIAKSERLHPENPVYQITFEEFKETQDDYEKTEMFYYAESDILCDEDNQPIDDPSYYLGTDDVNSIFDQDEEMPDTSWIRCNRIHTDIEVTREFAAYVEGARIR